jgi:ubiquinone biosynthesis protein COQ9
MTEIVIAPLAADADWAERAEARVLDAAVLKAPDQGWNRALLWAAAREAGLGEGDAELLFPEGPRDLAALLSRRHDDRALRALAQVDPAGLKIRERIRRGVLARCDAAMENAPAVRRWSGFLALPGNAALGLRLAWATADKLWRWAGDTATDENHYTKRFLLAQILIATLQVRLTLGAEAAEIHLDRQIGGVMTFEKWKAGLKPGDTASQIAGALGRLRYRPGRTRG